MVEDGGHVEGKGFGEFDIIARYFAPLATDASALSLRDDAAVLRPPEGLEIVLSCDTVIEGVHFLSDDPPDSIGHKALAVNLSDLAAKGARPYVYLLALSLPATRVTPDWLEAFASGLGDLQRHCGISLAGGDTTKTPGPLCITITALGLVPHGHAALRHGGKRGDLLYVTGTIGDAYLGLRLLKEPALAARLGLSEDDVSFLVGRYREPLPRNAIAIPLRNFASAAIDASDGLVGDVGKLAAVSHVGAVIEAARVPLSPASRKAVVRDPSLLEALLTGGDDYEIVASVPEASASAFENEIRAKGETVTQIGRLEERDGIRVLGEGGRTLKLSHKGFAHF
ncbi:MAG TPA: thiamine-phosphate kinase [Methyloceanibacter sp.]|jgi:thiamine-monophosphate kinase|nr:thiamine-phosphate kinase [Methyloceanibacter sp.]